MLLNIISYVPEAVGRQNGQRNLIVTPAAPAPYIYTAKMIETLGGNPTMANVFATPKISKTMNSSGAIKAPVFSAKMLKTLNGNAPQLY